MASSSDRRDPRSTRAFRALLSLYPGAFRDEYRRELTLVFIDRYRNANGSWDRLRLWFEAVIGVLTEAANEHVRMIRQDVRYGWRVLRTHALVTATIVLTLGLGIGLNTAMFSLASAVMLRSLPLPDSDQLFSVNTGDRVMTGPESARLSGPMFDRLRAVTLDGVSVAAMSRGVARVHTRTEDAPVTSPASLQLVSSSYFPVLGIRPALGLALPDDSAGTGDDGPLAVISHGYWQRRFAGARDVIGRSLTINGTAFTIVGVGPDGFSGVWLELPVDIWVPLAMQAALKYSQDFSADNANTDRPWMSQPNIWWLYVIARSPPERLAATTGAFNATLSALVGRDAGVAVEPFTRGFSRFRREFSLPIYALLTMAALVLLVACANVSNLLLARAIDRQREIAVRMALGAGRARLFHQLLTESALLVIMAGATALLFAGWTSQVIARMALATADTATPLAVPIDLRVLAFTAAVAFASVLLFGVMPARHATRLDVASALKAGARGSVGRLGRGPASLLVLVQVALSLVLVVGTGLVARSFQNLVHADLGFEPDRLLSVAIDPRLSGVPNDRFPQVYERLIGAVRSVPGVESVSLAMCGLQNRCRSRQDGMEVEGYRAQPNEVVVFVVNVVGPEYFATVGMPIIAGRAVSDRDLSGGALVAMVNKTLAMKYFIGGQAIGRHFGESSLDTEIVGVVDDARLLGPNDAPVPTVFFPLSQRGVAARSVEVRTQGAPDQAIAAVRRAVMAAAPELPIESITTMNERVHLGLSPWRLVMIMTSGFGLLALGLAGFGLFGVLSNAVARRSSEFGLRMALGASRPRVIWSVLREALWLVLGGLVLGLPLVFIGGRLVSTLLFGVSPYDGLSLLTAAVVLISVGILCSALPALRASRVDPIVALRQE